MIRPNLKELLLTSDARIDDLMPSRQRHRRRVPTAVEWSMHLLDSILLKGSGPDYR